MAGMRFKEFVGLVVAGAMLASSPAAAAAGTSAPAPQQVSPWAALSVLSGGVSAATLCGAAATAAAAQPATGCVLPVMDTPPPVASAPLPPAPVAPVAPAAAGFGVTPLLLGLVAIAAAAGLFLAVQNNHHGSARPNSPA